MSGLGYFVWPDGRIYEGEWSSNMKHGKGTYYFANGQVYKGDFKNDECHGTGTLFYPDGKRYEGQWREGKKNVHAYAKGIIVKRIENQPHDSTVGMLVQTALAAEWRRVTYNPYEHNTFVDVGNGRPVRRAAKVLALPGGSVWYTPEEDV